MSEKPVSADPRLDPIRAQFLRGEEEEGREALRQLLADEPGNLAALKLHAEALARAAAADRSKLRPLTFPRWYDVVAQPGGRLSLVLIALFVLFAGIGVRIGCLDLEIQRQLDKRGIRVQGRLVRTWQSDDKYTAATWFGYQYTANGHVYKKASALPGAHRVLPSAGGFPVVYLPENPRVARAVLIDGRGPGAIIVKMSIASLVIPVLFTLALLFDAARWKRDRVSRWKRRRPAPPQYLPSPVEANRRRPRTSEDSARR